MILLKTCIDRTRCSIGLGRTRKARKGAFVELGVYNDWVSFLEAAAFLKRKKRWLARSCPLLQYPYTTYLTHHPTVLIDLKIFEKPNNSSGNTEAIMVLLFGAGILLETLN